MDEKSTAAAVRGRILARLRGRVPVALVVSLAVHLLVTAGLWWIGGPRPVTVVRRPEPLFIELPGSPEPPPPAKPAVSPPGAATPPTRAPARVLRPPAPGPVAKAAPSPPAVPSPAPAMRATEPRPVESAPTAPSPQTLARVQEPSPSPAPAPPAAAPAPAATPPPPPPVAPAPVAAPPVPAVAPPPVAPPPPAVPPVPAPAPAPVASRAPTAPPPPKVEPPAQNVVEPAPPRPAQDSSVVASRTTSETAPRTAQEPARALSEAPAAPRTPGGAAEGGRPGTTGRTSPGGLEADGPRVAALPPQETPIDSLSAFRRGSAPGGRGGGWGGITGDAISINSGDPRFSDYLERLRRAIQAKMVFPCIKNPDTLRCEPKDAQLVVDMGLTRDGGVQVIEVMRTSGMSVYDEVSVNAIKLAQPFPPVPPSMLAAQPRGSAGVRITVLFSYIVTTWTQILIR